MQIVGGVVSNEVGEGFDWSEPVVFSNLRGAGGRSTFGFAGLYADYFDDLKEELTEFADVR
jgi:hypothetical protein